MEKINIAINYEIYQELEEYSQEFKISISEIVNSILKRELNKTLKDYFEEVN